MGLPYWSGPPTSAGVSHFFLGDEVDELIPAGIATVELGFAGGSIAAAISAVLQMIPCTAVPIPVHQTSVVD